MDIDGVGAVVEISGGAVLAKKARTIEVEASPNTRIKLYRTDIATNRS